MPVICVVKVIMPRKNTTDFQQEKDYQEARQTEGMAYFGSPAELVSLREDLALNQRGSEFYGCIFYPEWRNEYHPDTVYEQNKAFWAGLIDARRPLTLLTDISKFRGLGNTVDEMFWLQDNGYTFSPDPNHPIQTVVTPPEEEIPPTETFIEDYQKGSWPDKKPPLIFQGQTYSIKRQYLNKRRQTLIEDVLQQRLQCLAERGESSSSRPASITNLS